MTQAVSHAPDTHAHHAQGEEPLMAHGSVLQTGITNGKIATWLFLGSEVMFFTGLIGAYIVLRFAQDTWANPASETFPLNIPLTAFNTFLLICSSVTLVYGLQHIQAGNRGKGNLGLLLTTVFGGVFVGIQVIEYIILFSGHGHLGPFRPDSDLFGSCFYAMTGFHGFHVFIGVIAMGVLTVKGFLGHFGPKNYAAVELTGLYWHFVDLVWIILFAIVYLM